MKTETGAIQAIGRKLQPRIGILLLAVIFLTGLLTVPSYGFYLDETSEQQILFANLKEYIGYLPGETALEQELTDFGIEKISTYVDRDHGMAAYYPAFGVWYLNRLSPYLGSVFWHGYTFLLVFWGICCLYLLGKRLFCHQGTAAFMTLLFFLTPRMFAESHYNNKDMVLLSLCLVMFYHAYMVLQKLAWKDVVWLSAAGALAANMKVIGAWFFGMLGIYILLFLIAKKKMGRTAFWKASVCAVLWAFLYVMLTPACWPDMAGFISYLISYAVDYNRWRDYVLFQGRMLQKDYTGIPRKYLPVMMLYTIPAGILLLTALGYLRAVAELIKSKGRKFWEPAGYAAVTAFIGAVPLCYAVLAATPVYNGWRHFYFVYASLIIGAGYGFHSLWKKLVQGRKLWKLRLAAGLAAGYLLFLGLGIAVNFPQEHSYYNLLAGRNVVENYELDYWNLSVKEAFEIIRKDAGRDSRYTGGRLA